MQRTINIGSYTLPLAGSGGLRACVEACNRNVEGERMLSTKEVQPGDGATVGELFEAIRPGSSVLPPDANRRTDLQIVQELIDSDAPGIDEARIVDTLKRHGVT